ncbi:ABC transporter permease [Anaeropeptidivorans aminofermentans]|jgi:oligopeptide transport system permease protein|uniref:ABC transporter permease n=1 Tax=Anaeropeptidivorans aminofermentans TaxID=2934315 RepID=UPI002023DF01|nr:ABC transporter permease [Anaeropeptidivorans aminofermentans]MBE6011312.1 ABC transporter permease [Lachnospiraceae bacterium]
MLKYIIKRIFYMLITLFIIITATFFMIHSIPGDPLSYLAKNLPQQTMENYYKKYGLDKSKPEQYAIFMKNLAKGDLGESLRYPGRSITDTVATNSVVSGKTGGAALFIGFVVGVSLGIIAALNRNRWPDYIVMFVAIVGTTIPVFVMCALLQYALTVKIPVLPTTGWGKASHMVLPVIALSFGVIATYARYMKSSVLEVNNQDYILTAQAKGVSSFRIVTDHIIKNAILPCVTMLGPRIAGIFTGSFVVEKIFAIPGLGFYYVNSINDRDYSMILGITVFYAALFVIVQLLVDILYVFIDPRIRITD